MDIVDILKNEKKQIENQIKVSSSRLTSLKPGKLKIHTKRGEQYYIFSETEKKWKYVRKENLKEAKDIAQYEYEKEVLRESHHQYSLISAFAKNFNPDYIADIQEQFIPARAKLINFHLLSDEEIIHKWKEKKYEPNPYKLDNGYLTQNNELVRSKSEVIIADRLRALEIPYKYEFPVKLDDGVVYPDFTLLNIQTGREVFLEHFGMMDDQNYVNNNFIPKIVRYAKSGYFLGINLLATFESSLRPLDIRYLESVLNTIFPKIHSK